MTLRVNLAAPVPPATQLRWLRELLDGPRSVTILEQAVLVSLAAAGELDSAENRPVQGLTPHEVQQWVAFGDGDIWHVCLTLSQRGWVLHLPGERFALRVAYPVIEDHPVVEEKPVGEEQPGGVEQAPEPSEPPPV